jgi:tRNA(Ile2) C34 agmatinyltransferase TiaS
MPNQEELQKEFKHRYPEEYERQRKIAQEILKDIPEAESPVIFNNRKRQEENLH